MGRRKQRGFSLVELAVALVILALLLTGAVALLSAQKNTQALKQSRDTTDSLKQHLLNFLTVNHYLPCPDTDGDGYENRSNTTFVCKRQIGKNSPFGRAPYHDLGIPQTQVKDGWGNFIRYAINTETTQADKICHPQSSASYFCNQSAPTFNLQQTPPTAAERGSGNLYICNQNATTCAGTPSTAKLAKSGISAVLVAYNQDGQATLADCTAAYLSALNTENCDDDIYYQQVLAASARRSAVVDDYLQTISGYEIKNRLSSLPVIAVGVQ